MIDVEVEGWGRLAGAAAPTTPDALAATAAGSSDPDAHTALVMAHLDGLVVHRLAFPGAPPGSDAAAAGLTTLLRALIPQAG